MDLTFLYTSRGCSKTLRDEKTLRICASILAKVFIMLHSSMQQNAASDRWHRGDEAGLRCCKYKWTPETAAIRGNLPCEALACFYWGTPSGSVQPADKISIHIVTKHQIPICFYVKWRACCPSRYPRRTWTGIAVSYIQQVSSVSVVTSGILPDAKASLRQIALQSNRIKRAHFPGKILFVCLFTPRGVHVWTVRLSGSLYSDLNIPTIFLLNDYLGKGLWNTLTCRCA